MRNKSCFKEILQNVKDINNKRKLMKCFSANQLKNFLKGKSRGLVLNIKHQSITSAIHSGAKYYEDSRHNKFVGLTFPDPFCRTYAYQFHLPEDLYDRISKQNKSL